MKRHQTSSWEKEWDFQPNLQRAKDDWLDPVTPTYAYPPRDGRSERRNAARARQDAALGVSLTKDPAWKRKFIPTSERNAFKQTYPHRTDPVTSNSTNGTVLVKKSVYKPHVGRQASSPPRGQSRPNGSYPRGRSAPGNGGLVYDGNGESALQMAEEEREFGNHPPQSMERMYRETVRNRRTEHLRNNNHVEPEWEHQREIMDVVGAKSAEDLIDGGYDSRYRQPGTMLDVRRDRRIMSQNDRSSMAYRMFPENYKRLQGHDYDESTFGRDEAVGGRHHSAYSRRAASAHNSRAATYETLSRSTSSRQGRQYGQQEADLQRGNSRWEEEQGRSAYHALGNTTATSTAQPSHRRAPSKRVISGFHDDREEQDARMRRDQLDAADQRTRIINQSYDQSSAPLLSEVVSPTRNRYGNSTTRGRGGDNTSYYGGSSFVNNIRSTTGNHVSLPTYSSPLRGGGMDHPNRSSSHHNYTTHTSSMRTPYGGADLSAGAASFYGDRLAAHRPFTYPATPYQEVWGSSTQAAPSHYPLAPPASDSFVARSYDRFADVVSRFGPNSPMRGAENSYYPHQAAQPTMQTRSSYFNGDTGPIIVTTSAPTVLHSSIPTGMTPNTMMATPQFNTTINPLQPLPSTMPVGSGSPNSGVPSVYCATGHFYLGGEGGSPPRGVSFVEPVSMVVSHNMPPQPSYYDDQHGGTSLQESSAFSPNRRY